MAERWSTETQRCLAQAAERVGQVEVVWGPVVWWLNLLRNSPPPTGAEDGARLLPLELEAGWRMNPGPAPCLAPETHLQVTNFMTKIVGRDVTRQ